jgi:hypothetical protein
VEPPGEPDVDTSCVGLHRRDWSWISPGGAGIGRRGDLSENDGNTTTPIRWRSQFNVSTRPSTEMPNLANTLDGSVIIPNFSVF